MMKKIILFSVVVSILITSNNASGMLLTTLSRAPRMRKPAVLKSIQQRWYPQISQQERIEFIHVMLKTNIGIQSMHQRNIHAMGVMLQQNKICQDIIQGNNLSIQNLEKPNTHYYIYDMSDHLKLLEELEAQITKKENHSKKDNE